jgi:hypothetical protein
MEPDHVIEYELTDSERGLLLQLDKAISDLLQQRHGAMMLIAKQQNLEGNWSMSEDRRKFVRQEV